MIQEMGESLMYSWLRHVKGCQIVQTNWKLSPMWDLKHFGEIESWYNNLAQIYDKIGKRNIFGNQSVRQIMYQTECDVIGKCKSNNIYAVEVAYHSDGLHYKNTIKKVISKLIRISMCIYAIHGNIKAEIIFVTPVIKSHKAVLKTEIEKLNRRAKNLIPNNKFIFRLISDEDFTYKILHPFYLIGKRVNDNSEMFMRSVQLLQLKEPFLPELDVDKSFVEFGKIGQIANKVLRYYLEMQDKRTLDSYKDPKKSKEDFNTKQLLYDNPQTDLNKKPLTYSMPIKCIGGKKQCYYLFIDWKEKIHGDKLKKWIINQYNNLK